MILGVCIPAIFLAKLGAKYGLAGDLAGFFLGAFVVGISLDRFLESNFSVLKVREDSTSNIRLDETSNRPCSFDQLEELETQMKIIKEKPWSYVLFDDGQGWALTFMIGGVVEVDVCVRLEPEEISMIKADKKNILKIMRNIEHDRNENKPREIIPPIWPKC